MDLALSAAATALGHGEVPVGAVIIAHPAYLASDSAPPTPQVIASAHNLVHSSGLVLHHAEMLAIEQACRATHSPYLSHCDMYVTLEPCYMCLGAIMHCRIRRLYYGVANPKYGAFTCGFGFPRLGSDSAGRSASRVETGKLSESLGKPDGAVETGFRSSPNPAGAISSSPSSPAEQPEQVGKMGGHRNHHPQSSPISSSPSLSSYHLPEVYSGLLEDECRGLLRQFFTQRRS